MACIIENLNIDKDLVLNDQIYVSLQWYQDAIKVQEMLKEQQENAKTIFDNLEIIDRSIKNISNSFNEIKEYNNKLLKFNKILISEHPYLIEDKLILHNKCDKATNIEIERTTKKQKLYEIEVFRTCKCVCYW
jgi:Lhr-like helicase